MKRLICTECGGLARLTVVGVLCEPCFRTNRERDIKTRVDHMRETVKTFRDSVNAPDEIDGYYDLAFNVFCRCGQQIKITNAESFGVEEKGWNISVDQHICFTEWPDYPPRLMSEHRRNAHQALSVLINDETQAREIQLSEVGRFDVLWRSSTVSALRDLLKAIHKAAGTEEPTRESEMCSSGIPEMTLRCDGLAGHEGPHGFDIYGKPRVQWCHCRAFYNYDWDCCPTCLCDYNGEVECPKAAK